MATGRTHTIFTAVMGMAAAPVAAQGWQGPYIGFHLGGAAADFSSSAVATAGPSGDATEFLGGLQLGYNWQRGNSVLGAEADISFTDISDEFAGGRFDEDLMTSVRLRAGVMQGETLFYGSLGVAWTEQQTTLNGVGSSHDLEPGVMFGAGAETFLGDHVSGRVEAFYVDAPTVTRNIGGTTSVSGSKNVVFRAGLSLHF